MKRSFLFAFLSFAICALSAFAVEPGHIGFGDSSAYFRIRGTLGDSVSVSRFTNTDQDDKHVENSLFVNLYINGAITQNFAFHASASVMSDRTTRTYEDKAYNPYNGIPYNVQSPSSRTWDTFTAASEYRFNENIRMMGGVDYLSWGPARRNKLTLRGADHNYRPWMDSTDRIAIPAPTPYFGYEFEIGPVTYTQYAGKLYHDKHKGKYFHAHRLNLELPWNIDFGLSETIVYGSTVEAKDSNPNEDADSTNRGFEWIYAAPFIPYLFCEHYTGDLENTSISFDVSVKTIPNWEIYGELLWDDMKTPTSMFNDSWWGNKWAASLGLGTDNRQIGPILLSYYSEFTWIEPWVYTHHKGAGYTYTHYGQSFGSNLGPNSREFYTEVRAAYKDLEMKLFASNVAKDTAFGGNLYDIHTPYDPTDRTYLADKTTLHYHELGFGIKFTPLEWLWANYSQSFYLGDYEGYRMSGNLGVTW